MNFNRIWQYLILALSLLLWAPSSYSQEDIPVEITVVGRQPGPPMWKVFNGDNVLWIFPHLSLVPKNMIWDSTKVEAVISASQEALEMPEVDVSISKLVMFNPINIFRGMRLAKRLTKNPDGERLDEVMPAELYARFAVLKAQYFSRNNSIEKQRPLVAGGQMVNLIQDEADLVSGDDINKKIRRLIRRNKNIQRTKIEVDMKIEGGFGVLAKRVENLLDSLSPAQELACFENQIERMETDLDESRYRANAWAMGYIDEFRFVSLPGDADDECTNWIFASSENETVGELLVRMNDEWLRAAEKALATNQSTFAVLTISELVKEGGLFEQLRDKGYEVKEP